MSNPPTTPAIIPQLVLANGNEGLAFYQRALGAEVLHAMPGPNGGLMHAAMKIGQGTVFVSDANEFSKPTQANTFTYVDDVDAAFGRATEAGATVLAPVADMFWGDRWCMLADPYGNVWQLATHVEDVSPEEMQKRLAAQAPS